MPFLLDANACIALINGRDHAAREHFNAERAAGQSIQVSSIAEFGLWYGVGKSQHRDRNAERLRAFFKGPVDVLAFDSEGAEAAGLVRADLESKGRPIGPYDLLIAAQAVRRNLTLVTANHTEFSRIKDLHWVDWTKPRRK